MKDIVSGALFIVMGLSCICQMKMIDGLRRRVNRMEELQAEKNARYENAIGFFKFAVNQLNNRTLVMDDLIKFYAKTEDDNLYDINGDYPVDYMFK